MMTDTTARIPHLPSLSQNATNLPSTQLTGIVATSIFALLQVGAIAQRPVALTPLILKVQNQTGAVVPGATIQIDAPRGDVHVKTQSDATGHLAIGLHPGKYILTVGEPGFRTLYQTVSITSLDSQSKVLTLQVGSGSSATVIPSEAMQTTNTVLTRTLDDPAVQIPIEIKVVVISMFEIGADTGDIPGEYQYWVEREHLTQILSFPQGYHDIRLNPQTGVLGLLTGMGTARATASVMALGLDPRFDLTHAYFLVAGIAGIDPHVGSLGSAVWADYIVDGDLGHEIDAREIPPTWTTGHVPLRKSTPYEQPRTDDNGLAYHLNATLTAWAYNLTKDTKLTDTPEIAARRQAFLPEDPASPAHRPPFVLRGDILSASNFWHGKLMSKWAEDWVAYQTDGKGHYAACGMEDTGTLESLTRLAHAGKIDLNRVMVLRTASNYDQQRSGITASESLAETKITKYGAFLPSLDTAYRVGHQVVDALVANWPQTREHIPSATITTAKKRQ